MKFLVTILMSLSILMAGCSSPTRYLRANEILPIYETISPELDVNEVRATILSVASQKGWQLESEDTVNHEIYLVQNRKEKLIAKIKIAYSSSGYQMYYVDSKGFKYDGEKIHKRFNRWVVSLNENIKQTLSDIKFNKSL
ncbi:MAG: hypothetical protein SPK70_10490, partial [Succinivibrio dextrinosolvens]|nr:hypothetical protein [Succinivibrio dextrinosolvens]